MNKINIVRYIIAFIGIGVMLYSMNLFTDLPMNNECQNLMEEGYFETKYDTPGYIDCAINYSVGINECNLLQKKMLDDDEKKNCFSYDEYDFECSEERWKSDEDLQYFGMYCVWGGIGWMMFIGCVGLWTFGLGLFAAACLGGGRLEK